MTRLIVIGLDVSTLGLSHAPRFSHLSSRLRSRSPTRTGSTVPMGYRHSAGNWITPWSVLQAGKCPAEPNLHCTCPMSMTPVTQAPLSHLVVFGSAFAGLARENPTVRFPPTLARKGYWIRAFGFPGRREGCRRTVKGRVYSGNVRAR